MASDPQAPPVPPIPEPPSFGPDLRQEAFFKEVGQLLDQAGDKGGLDMVSLTDWTGFPASSPDLGRLTDLIQEAFGEWAEPQLQAHWHACVEPWLHHLVSVWVQRVRRREIRLLPGGAIEIFLMARDDFGDYSYHMRVLRNVSTRRAA